MLTAVVYWILRCEQSCHPVWFWDFFSLSPFPPHWLLLLSYWHTIFRSKIVLLIFGSGWVMVSLGNNLFVIFNKYLMVVWFVRTSLIFDAQYEFYVILTFTIKISDQHLHTFFRTKSFSFEKTLLVSHN